MTMTKQKLRQNTLIALSQFSADKSQKDLADEELLAKLLATPCYQTAKVIATYLSMPHEFNTEPFIKQALKDHKVIVVPKTFPKGKMIFVPYHEEQLEKTVFGVLEPTSNVSVSPDDIDLIHVPGLIFSPDGYRVGYGAGYYDRYLSTYQGDTISTVYPFQIQHFKKEAFDIPVRKLLQ